MNTAVVTGAGRGLGRAIARGLAGRGYAVLVTDIDAEAAAATATAIGAGAWSVEQDVRDPDSHRRVAEEAASRGALGVWVNNAGILRSAPAWEHGDDDIRMQVDINVLGVMWGCRAAVRAMQAHGGHIINITSMSALVPTPGVAVYGATKHAVLGYSISLKGDLDAAGLPIEVSAICPDAIDTKLVRDVADNKSANILFAQRHLLTVENVAKVALDVLDDPKLVVAYPRRRGALAHIFRPFPQIGLKVLGQMAALGGKHRKSFGDR